MNRAPTQHFKSTTSTGSSPRIALIGCGAIAEAYYLPALAKELCGLETLTLVDQDMERAQKLAATFGVKNCVTDYREILDQVDGVIVALPTHLHHPISMEFLSRGVHVLCEKPLAESAKSAQEMVDLAKEKGATLAVNYLQRLIPSFAKVKEWLSDKKFGDLRHLKYRVGEEFNWPSISGFYFNSPVSARGILRDRGAHVIDHICWWLGSKPKLISSQNDSFGGSDALACIEFEHGRCSGEIKLSWLGAFPSQYSLGFENATVIGDVYDYQNLIVEDHNGRRKHLKVAAKEKTKLDIAQKIVNNFLDVIKNGAQPLISGKDVLESIEFVDECYAAATQLDMPWYAALEEVKNA